MKTYEVPLIWEACLAYINEELCRVQGNITQAEYASPFGNYGNSYKNDTFEVVAYDWAMDLDDNAPAQPYNFKWKDVEITWYKYLGRDMQANQELTPELASECLIECVNSIRGEDVI